MTTDMTRRTMPRFKVTVEIEVSAPDAKAADDVVTAKLRYIGGGGLVGFGISEVSEIVYAK